MAAILSGCGQQKKSSETNLEEEAATEATMDEAMEAETEQESKDYLARCNCEDCDDYILIMERGNYIIARYYLDEQFGEFDVSDVEFRTVDEERLNTTYEYIFRSASGLERVVLYTNAGNSRVGTVIMAGVDQDNDYTEINCISADVYDDEISPNIDLEKFHEIDYERKGYSIWYTEHLNDSGANVNHALAEITRDDRFAPKIILRGKELYLVDGAYINSYRDYDITFQTETFNEMSRQVTQFTDYPSLSLWSEEFAWGGEIRHLDIEDNPEGLYYDLAMYSPQFTSWDTFTLHYTYDRPYYSLIRPGFQDFEYGVSYTDTMMLLGYNDDYDYEFATFLTQGAREVKLIGGEYLFVEYQYKVMVIQWQFDTFYEAGRGEETYVQENIISWELTDLPPFEFDNY